MGQRLVFRVETEDGKGPFTNFHDGYRDDEVTIPKGWKFGCIKLWHLYKWQRDFDGGILGNEPDIEYNVGIYRVNRSGMRISPRRNVAIRPSDDYKGYECLFLPKKAKKIGVLPMHIILNRSFFPYVETKIDSCF